MGCRAQRDVTPDSIKGNARSSADTLLLVRTCVIVKAGPVEFAYVELQANDGKHEDGKEKEEANLQQGNHGLHDGFEHHL